LDVVLRIEFGDRINEEDIPALKDSATVSERVGYIRSQGLLLDMNLLFERVEGHAGCGTRQKHVTKNVNWAVVIVESVVMTISPPLG
jgi:hypothetical protein